jgi:hypothetical protein
VSHPARTLQIHVANGSSRVSDADVRRMTRAVATQVREHFAPAWEIPVNPVTFLADPKEKPTTGAVLTVWTPRTRTVCSDGTPRGTTG